MSTIRIVTLKRLETSDEGTFGKLTTEGFECYTAELPSRGNIDNLSRIPAGKYEVRWSQSPSRKNPDGSPEWTFRLQEVPGREGILIHSGNFCGDKTKGYAADVEGCILLGRAIVEGMEIPEAKRKAHPAINKKKQKGVTSSRDTLASFVNHMTKDPFKLDVQDAG